MHLVGTELRPFRCLVPGLGSSHSVPPVLTSREQVTYRTHGGHWDPEDGQGCAGTREGRCCLELEAQPFPPLPPVTTVSLLNGLAWPKVSRWQSGEGGLGPLPSQALAGPVHKGPAGPGRIPEWCCLSSNIYCARKETQRGGWVAFWKGSKGSGGCWEGKAHIPPAASPYSGKFHVAVWPSLSSHPAGRCCTPFSILGYGCFSQAPVGQLWPSPLALHTVPHSWDASLQAKAHPIQWGNFFVPPDHNCQWACP